MLGDRGAYHKPRRAAHLASDTAVAVLFERRVENTVGYIIANLVGVSFRDAFVLNAINGQSPDIARGVDEAIEVRREKSKVYNRKSCRGVLP